MTDIKPTPTRDEVWATLLRLWHSAGLPTPIRIEVGLTPSHGIEVELPDNERGQVDRWAAALGLPTAVMAPFPDGETGRYRAGGTIANGGYDTATFPGWYLTVRCYLRLTADADAHWAGPAGFDTDPRAVLADQLVGAGA